MPAARSSIAHRLEDYASANWPRVWRLRPHLVLLVLCLSVTAGLALVPLLPSDAKEVATRHWLLGGVAFTALSAALLYWIRVAAGRTLHVRAFPGLRYSPHIIVVLVVAALNIGAFALVAAPRTGPLPAPLFYWGETSIYFHAFSAMTGYLGIALLMCWFSTKALLWFIIATLISQFLQGALGQQLGLRALTLFSVPILLAFVVSALVMLARGARRWWTHPAAVIAFTLGLHGNLTFLLDDPQIADFGPTSLSQGYYLAICAELSYVACFSLLTWLVGKVDLLPEMVLAPPEGSAGSSVRTRAAQTGLSAGLQRAADQVSRRWPSLWRLRPDLLLVIACLSFALGQVLAGPLPTLHATLPGDVPRLDVGFGGTLFVLVASLLYWLYAVGVAPPIRAFPQLRYRPRVAFVAAATAFLFALVMIFPGGDRIIISGPERFSTSDPRLFLVVNGYTYAMLLLVMTTRWFSLRRTLFALVVLLALTAYFGAFPMEGLLLVLGAVLILAAFMIVTRVRGARNRWVPGAMVLTIYLVHFAGTILAIFAAVLAERRQYSSVLLSLTSAASLTPVAILASVLMVQLVCWASAKLDLLPERR